MSHEQERAAALIDAVGQHFYTLINASSAAISIKTAIRLATTIVEVLGDIHTAERTLVPELQNALKHIEAVVEALTHAAAMLETRIEASSDRTLAQFGSKL